MTADAASEEDVTAHSQGNDKDSNSSSDSEYGDPAGGHGGGSIRPFQHEGGPTHALEPCMVFSSPAPLSSTPSCSCTQPGCQTGRGLQHPHHAAELHMDLKRS